MEEDPNQDKGDFFTTQVALNNYDNLSNKIKNIFERDQTFKIDTLLQEV